MIFWTTRGHRCLPFSPQLRSIISHIHRVHNVPNLQLLYASRFSSNFANSRARASRSSIFTQEKAPTTRTSAMLCYAVLCYAMLCYAMLRYALLCYAMLCYAMHSVRRDPTTFDFITWYGRDSPSTSSGSVILLLVI